MNLLPLLNDARALLSEGETGKALQLLISGLEKQPQFAETTRTLRLLESNFAAARQQELKGILSFSESQREYSKTTDALLAIMDDLQAGRKPAPERQSRRRLLLMGAAAALLLAALSFFYFRGKPDCPEFNEKNAARVMLLPFENVGSMPAKPESVLQNRIRTLTRKNNFPVDIGILQNFNAAKQNPDLTAATELGEHCSADLVVWGQYSVGNDSTRVSIQYKFTKTGDEGSTGTQAVKDITGLENGRIAKGLDDAIFSLCGVLAMHEQRWDLARKWLEKVNEKDSNDVKMMEWLAKNGK